MKRTPVMRAKSISAENTVAALLVALDFLEEHGVTGEATDSALCVARLAIAGVYACGLEMHDLRRISLADGISLNCRKYIKLAEVGVFAGTKIMWLVRFGMPHREQRVVANIKKEFYFRSGLANCIEKDLALPRHWHEMSDDYRAEWLMAYKKAVAALLKTDVRSIISKMKGGGR